jgi:hypothetical protein
MEIPGASDSQNDFRISTLVSENELWTVAMPETKETRNRKGIQMRKLETTSPEPDPFQNAAGDLNSVRLTRGSTVAEGCCVIKQAPEPCATSSCRGTTTELNECYGKAPPRAAGLEYNSELSDRDCDPTPQLNYNESSNPKQLRSHSEHGDTEKAPCPNVSR